MRLFIELYLDEDVDVLIADLLRARGFNVLTTRDAGRLRATDEEQLAFAAAEHRTLLTHNRVDFEALHLAYLSAGQDHAGIIVARRHPAQEVAQRLLIILNAVTADEMPQSASLYLAPESCRELLLQHGTRHLSRDWSLQAVSKRRPFRVPCKCRECRAC